MHITRRSRARNRRIFSASATALIACFVIVGWRFDIGLLKTALPGLVAMNPISAVAFLFAALSITFFSFPLVSFGTISCQGNPVSLATPTGKNAGRTMARRLLPAAILVPAAIGWLRLEGQRTEIFDNEMGLALQTVANMVFFAFVVIWNARLLSRTDAERSKAELLLRRAHRELESRVHERTEQFFTANQSLQLASGELEDRVRERTAILAETEARLHAIVENANSIILVKDLEGKIILANQRFATLVGRPKEEIIGRTDYDFFPKKIADEFRAHDLEAIRIGAVTEKEETVPRSDGSCHTFIANKFPLRDSNGNIYAFCDISTDITERKQMEDTLLENQRALEASVYANQLIMDNSRDVICTVDEAGRFVTVNAACETLWGYTTKELEGKRYIEMVLAEDREKTNRVAAEIVAGAAASDFENRYARKDGSIIHMLWSAYW
nr:PAS domain S-box protein [Chthoniobacterales bacterium]